jgi:hypothetical protein
VLTRTKRSPSNKGEQRIDEEKPWGKYRKEPVGPGRSQLYWKVLVPGWGGQLSDCELEFIQAALQADPMLSYWWGFRLRARRRPIEAIKSVSMRGSPDVRAHNVKLVRPHQCPVAAQMALPWA